MQQVVTETDTKGVATQDGSEEAASPQPASPVSVIMESENICEDDSPDKKQGNKVCIN